MADYCDSWVRRLFIKDEGVTWHILTGVLDPVVEADQAKPVPSVKFVILVPARRFGKSEAMRQKKAKR